MLMLICSDYSCFTSLNDLNTSHVNVNHLIFRSFFYSSSNLNTSHVNVNQYFYIKILAIKFI